VPVDMDNDYGHSFARPCPPAADCVPKGYWIISVRVLDKMRYDQYLDVAIDAIDRAGGDMIIRSDTGTIGAGSPKPRIVVVEFASLAAATDAFKSLAQQAAMLMYDQVADYDLLVVEGLGCRQ